MEKYYLCFSCRTVLGEQEIRDNNGLCPTCGIRIRVDDEILPPEPSTRRRACRYEEIFGEEVDE